MFKSYLLSAIRNLKKESVITTINLLGLATGLAATIIIFLYVSKELDYDNLSNAENIYRVEFQKVSDQSPKWPVVPHTWPDKYVSQLPEVLEYTQIRRSSIINTIVVGQERFFETDLITSSPGIINIFDLQLIGAATSEPLRGRKKVIISKERAESYFQGQDPVGQFLSINGEDGFLVTGVFEKRVPVHLDFEIIQSVDETIQRGPFYWLFTYLHMSDGADYKAMAEKVNNVADEFSDPFFDDTEFRLVPMKNIYFEVNKFYQSMKYGDLTSVYIFMVLGLTILVTASLNFINLTAAGFIQRVKEVGVRRVLGSTNLQLAGRFIVESGLTLFTTYFVGLLLVKVAIPIINQHLGVHLNFPEASSPVIWLSMLFFVAMALTTASYASRFSRKSLNSSQGRKGQSRGHYKNLSLLFQFTVSTLLIVGMILVKNQLNFMKDHNLGFGDDRVYMINMLKPTQQPKLETYTERLASHRSVISASTMMGSPGNPSLVGNQNFWAEGMSQNENIFLSFYAGDENIIKTLGLNIIEGQDFSEGVNLTDGTLAAIVNESAVRRFGWKESVGKRMTLSGTPVVVMGVVEDFHFQSLQNSIQPVAIIYNYNPYMIAVRIRPDGVASVMDFMKEEWMSIDPENEMQGFFLEESFNDQYAHEERLGLILDILTYLAVIISAMGTLALVMLIIRQKTKVVGIHKVLGASLVQIFLLLNKRVFGLLLIANVLAWPVAFYFGNQWLHTFAYQVDLSLRTFLIAGIVTFLFVFVTLSYHSLKAAIKNPIDSLRYE